MFTVRSQISRVALAQQQMRFFGVGPKMLKMEMTMRTPYKTFFKNFAGFENIYIPTASGRACINNYGEPGVYLMPAGEIEIMGLKNEGEGKKTHSTSGNFMTSGGWAFVHA